MTQSTIEQALSNSWPKRFIVTLTDYDITRIWEVGARFILSFLTLTLAYCSAGALTPLILTGGTYAYKFSS